METVEKETVGLISARQFGTTMESSFGARVITGDFLIGVESRYLPVEKDG